MANVIQFDNKTAQHILQEELEAARQQIINHIRANGQNASGKTIASLRVETKDEEGVLYGHKPFGVLETGRKAGRVPYGFASLIYQWMQDKGLHATPMPYKRQGFHKYSAQERADRSMAAAIARTIKTKGSLLHRKGGRDDVYSNVVPKTLERVRQRLISLISTDISHIVLASERNKTK